MGTVGRLVISVLALSFSFQAVSSAGGGRDSALVMFWNLENFFDYRDGGNGGPDTEFSENGERRWSKSRFYRKCSSVSKVIFWAESFYGRMPDIIGFAEVENRFVLNSVFKGTLLKKYDYGIVHYESGDRRGIDVALAYRKDIFQLRESRPVKVLDRGEVLKTRDILYAGLECTETGEDISVAVCHFPSAYGGKANTVWARCGAMHTLMTLCDSLKAAGAEKIVVMGDFNDTPDGSMFRTSDSILVNKARALHEKGKGTIRYRGKWSMIDMFLVSLEMDECSAMHICAPDFILCKDNVHSGMKPLRTYSGPGYEGGVSDHLPVVLEICH